MMLAHFEPAAFYLINPAVLNSWHYAFMMAGAVDLKCEGGVILHNCEAKGSQSVSIRSTYSSLMMPRGNGTHSFVLKP